MGVGAATLTAAALVLGPGTAAGAPVDPDEAMQAMEDAVDQARQAADDAARAAEEAAQAAREAMDQATRAAEDAAEGAGGAGGDITDERIDTDPTSVDWLREDLQDDLQALEDVPADERAEEMEAIFRDAVTGDYGEEVENWSERMLDFTDALPEDLRNDLQSVVGMPQDEARERLEEIWQGVLEGDYGEEVQTWGTWLRQSFQQWDLGSLIQGDVTPEPADRN